MTDFHIIIPARYKSSRLPGKPLLDIKGKSLLERVYERATLCGAQSVTIATDDERIEDAALKFGGAVCRTSEHHPTGTDRLAEAVEKLGLSQNAIVVNLQGDEPLVPINCIHTIVKSMQDNPKAFMTTICSPILDADHLRDPNVVKVVLDKSGFALYFSRSLMPYPRESQSHNLLDELMKQQQEPHFYRHIGLFAYRARSLKRYQTLSQPLIEKLELIEALRILWHGEQIHVSVVPEPLPPGVDTLAELEHMRSLF